MEKKKYKKFSDLKKHDYVYEYDINHNVCNQYSFKEEPVLSENGKLVTLVAYMKEDSVPQRYCVLPDDVCHYNPADNSIIFAELVLFFDYMAETAKMISFYSAKLVDIYNSFE